MPDRPPDQPTRDRRAFTRALVICAAFPVASAVLLLIGGDMESPATLYGIYAFAASPVAWGLVLLDGLVGRAHGRPGRRLDVVLGVLAGAVIGALLFVGAGMLTSVL